MSNYAFIDNENVNISVQKQWWKIDWWKLKKRLAEELNVTTVYMFMWYTPESQEMYTFFQTLGYTLIFKPMTGLLSGNQKGNVDAELVLQAMIDIDVYNQAVIMSWDGDFACLVKYLYNKNKLATLIVPNRARYSELLKYAAKEKIRSLNPLKRELAYKPVHRRVKKEKEAADTPASNTPASTKPARKPDYKEHAVRIKPLSSESSSRKKS